MATADEGLELEVLRQSGARSEDMEAGGRTVLEGLPVVQVAEVRTGRGESMAGDESRARTPSGERFKDCFWVG